MRTIKKISGMLISTMLLFVFVSTIAYAAPGSVTFTDLDTPAGEEFTVRMGIRSGGATLGDCNIVLNYDNQAIEFLSADNISASGNTLTYSATGNSDYAFAEMQFRALKQGETKITIDNCDVKDSQGNVLSLDEGHSSVKVEGGTEVEATETSETTESTDSSTEEVVDNGGININGVAYTVGTEFLGSEIPNGYSEALVTYNGVEYTGAKSDTAEIQLLYLLNDMQEGEFFYFDVETNTFSPYVQVTVSDSTFIIFLNTTFAEVLPEQFVETTLTVSGYEFPTWEDTMNKGFYIIHAISSNGERGAYQYDSAEQTYQRYVIPEVVVEEVVVEEDFAAMVVSACGEYLLYVLIGIASVVVLMFLLVIITLVKLRNRNLELDDLYDELDHRSNSKSGNRVEENNKNSVNKTQPKKLKKQSKKVDEFDSLILTSDEEDFEGNQHEFKAEFNDEYDQLESEFDLSEMDLNSALDSSKVRNVEEKGSVQRKIKKSRPSIEEKRSEAVESVARRTGIKDKKAANESTGRKIRGDRPRNDKPDYIDL